MLRDRFVSVHSAKGLYSQTDSGVTPPSGGEVFNEVTLALGVVNRVSLVDCGGTEGSRDVAEDA